MGITGLNAFLKKKHHIPEKDRFLSEFHGKRIGIDMHINMYKNLYGAQKKTLATTDVVLFGNDRSETLRSWIEMILNLVIDLVDFGVTPVVIFDGVSVPEKGNTKKKRKSKTADTLEKIAKLEKDISKFDPTAVPKAMSEELRKLYSQVVYVNNEEQEYLRQILTSIGIPVVQAVGEAEQLCSMMCIEGVVDAVYSTDTDTFPLGCPLVVKKMERKKFSDVTGKFDRKLTTVALSDILKILGFSYATFVDFCIMCGNDFNENIYNTGAVKSYKLLKVHGSIDKLPSNIDKSVLKHVRSREIFAVKPWKDCYVAGNIDLHENGLPDTARDVLESIDKAHMMDKLIDATRKCPKPKDRGWTIPPEQKKLSLKITKLII